MSRPEIIPAYRVPDVARPTLAAPCSPCGLWHKVLRQRLGIPEPGSLVVVRLMHWAPGAPPTMHIARVDRDEWRPAWSTGRNNAGGCRHMITPEYGAYIAGLRHSVGC